MDVIGNYCNVVDLFADLPHQVARIGDLCPDPLPTVPCQLVVAALYRYTSKR